MLLIEKNKDKIKEIIKNSNTDTCLFNAINNELFDNYCKNFKELLDKLLEEYKEPFKVTPYELETLKLLFGRGCLYITRNIRDDYVNFHNIMPSYYDGNYSETIDTSRSLNDTFDFVEEEKIYKIEEILNNYEVIENEQI